MFIVSTSWIGVRPLRSGDLRVSTAGRERLPWRRSLRLMVRSTGSLTPTGFPHPWPDPGTDRLWSYKRLESLRPL